MSSSIIHNDFQANKASGVGNNATIAEAANEDEASMMYSKSGDQEADGNSHPTF